MKLLLHAIAMTGLFTALVASGAEGACITPSQRSAAGSGVAKDMLLHKAIAFASTAAIGSDGSDNSIVGLWFTTFYAGEGPDVWDQAYEQWHIDGTELAIDNAVPPSLGNVCVGVWKQDGRTVHLRHFTFNWNPDGTKAGTFTLTMSVAVDKGGKTYSGRYVSDSYDVDGNLIPELHGEGVVRGIRITAD